MTQSVNFMPEFSVPVASMLPRVAPTTRPQPDTSRSADAAPSSKPPDDSFDHALSNAERKADMKESHQKPKPEARSDAGSDAKVSDKPQSDHKDQVKTDPARDSETNPDTHPIKKPDAPEKSGEPVVIVKDDSSDNDQVKVLPFVIQMDLSNVVDSVLQISSEASAQIAQATPATGNGLSQVLPQAQPETPSAAMVSEQLNLSDLVDQVKQSVTKVDVSDLPEAPVIAKPLDTNRQSSDSGKVSSSDAKVTAPIGPKADQPITDFVKVSGQVLKSGSNPVLTTPRLLGSSDPAQTAPNIARQMVGSEWTRRLDLARLLNPKMEASSEPSRKSSVPETPVWSPRPRPEVLDSSIKDFAPKPQNQTEVSGHPSKSNQTWVPDSGKLSVNPIVEQSKASEAILRQVYRPILESVKPAATTDTQAPPIVQTVKPAAVPNPVTSINPEKLVSDVRQAVIKLASDGHGEIKLILNPPELGELVIKLQSSKNGVMRAEFHTMSPLVRDTLEAGLTRLIDALKAEGLTLSQAEVHLSFNFGAQHGQSGETGSNQTGSNNSTSQQSIDGSDSSDSVPVLERLPDGATISLFA